MENLVTWCFQFISSDSTVLEIGIFEDSFFERASGFCKNIISLKELKSEDNHQIDFMRICELGLDEIDRIISIAEINTYPPIITIGIDNNFFDIFKKKGYSVVRVNGCDNCYLICDHPERVSKNDSEPWSMMYSSAIFDINNNNFKQGVQKLKAANNFCDKDNKRINILENLSKICFKAEQYELGMEASLNILYSNRTEWGLRNDVVENMKHYITPINFYKTKSFGINLGIKCHPSSPCLVKVDGGYIYNIRSVNYNISHDGSYIIRDADDIIRTENYFICLDHRLKKVGDPQRLILGKDFEIKGRIRGLEDMRLIDDKTFFCTCLQFNNKNTPQMCYGEYESKEDFRVVSTLQPMMINEELKTEKNWLPYKTEEGINFIYSFHPFRVYGLRNGKIIKIFEKKFNKNLDFYRGSAPPIDFCVGGIEGKLMTVHIVHSATPRKYFHLFFWISNDYENWKVSLPFYFSNIGIEFNLSITDFKDSLIVCYSVNDNSANLGFIKKIEVENMLK